MRRLSGDLIHLRLNFREIKAAVEVGKVGDQQVNIRVKIIKETKPDFKIRISLQKDKRDLSSYVWDRKNDILFENVLYGRYMMLFSCNSKTVGMYPFEIKENPYDRRQDTEE